MTDSDFPTREMLNITRGSSLGRYEILERIGAGGMGEVFLARDSSLKRNVAIKFPPQHLAANKAYTSRLLREAQAAGGLDHPGIVHMYDVGEYQGRPYLVMEHVTGEPLDVSLRQGPLSPQAAIRIGRHLAEALDYAHRHGVLHRDIKPANVIIDIHGRPKLVDFGLAFSPDDIELSQANSTLGTVGYMAPEIIKGETATGRSDLFSLGVLLYKAVTGSLPFAGDTQATVINAVLQQEIKWPQDTGTPVPAEFQKLISSLVEKNPKDRPESGAEVAERLRAMGGDTTTGPHPQASPRRIPRAVPVALGVLLVAAAAFGILRKTGGPGDLPGTAEAAVPKVIVMPFENLAGGDRQDPMGEVMSSLIITGLSQSRSLSVVSNDYAHQLRQRMAEGSDSKDMAREVNARWLITGKILQQEPNLVVASELIDPHAGTILTAERVEGTPGETVFQVVDRLTAQLKNDLAVTDDSPPVSVADATTHSPEAYADYTQGQTRISEFQFNQALAPLERAVELDPTFAQAWVLLAHLYDRFGNIAKRDTALARSERNLDGLPRREQLFVREMKASIKGNYVVMLSTLEECHQLDPQDPFVLFRMGVARQNLGQIPAAVKAWEEAIALDPNFAPAYNQLAYRYLDVGEFDKSLWAINEYIRLSPGKPNPYDSRGDLYARAGQLDLAIESYEKALEIDPSFFPSKRNIGEMYAFKGNPGRAERLFQSVAQEAQGSFPGVVEEAQFCSAMLPAGMGQFQTTLANLKALADRSAERDGDYLMLMALVYDYLENTELAISTARRVLGNPVSDPVMHEIAEGILIRMLDREGPSGRAEYQKRVAGLAEDSAARVAAWNQLPPEERRLPADFVPENNYALTFFLGHAYRQGEEWQKTVETLEPVLNVYVFERFCIPQRALIYYDLGVAYQETGRTDEAVDQLTTFLDRWKNADPGLPEVADARTRLNALQTTP